MEDPDSQEQGVDTNILENLTLQDYLGMSADSNTHTHTYV